VVLSYTKQHIKIVEGRHIALDQQIMGGKPILVPLGGSVNCNPAGGE
jgi:hypothetical protein